MLICTVSLTLQEAMDVTVHNQYPDIELMSPVYFCNHEICHEYSVERTDVGDTMKIGFRFDIGLNEHGGILMCEVQRKGNKKSDHQSNTDTTSIEAVEDASKMMQLLVAWKFYRPRKYRIRIVLVEHCNELVLNEEKLAKLYDKIYNIPSEVYKWILKYDSIYKSTWLMRDNTVLEAVNETIREKGFELKITISKGVRNLDAMKPFWMDSTR
jgi:hypothetical protein